MNNLTDLLTVSMLLLAAIAWQFVVWFLAPEWFITEKGTNTYFFVMGLISLPMGWCAI